MESQICVDPMKDAVFEVLFNLYIHHPFVALQPNLVEGPF